MPGRGITSRFIYIVILTWLFVGVDFGILILVLDAEREIAVKEEIGLFNSIMAGEPLSNGYWNRRRTRLIINFWYQITDEFR